LSNLKEDIDYYKEGDRVVFTTLFHLKRGNCCGNGCKYCPYQPKYLKNNTIMDIEILKALKEQAEFLEKNQDNFTMPEKTEKAIELYTQLNQLLSNTDTEKIEQE
jgi:biotin synthase-like enzyme